MWPVNLCRLALGALAVVLAGATAAAGDASVRLVRLFPTTERPVEVFAEGIVASPVVAEVRGETAVLVAARDRIAVVDPRTGATRSTIELPRPDEHYVELLATPVAVGSRLVVAYQIYDDGERKPHRVMVVDLTTGTRDEAYPVIELAAEVPVDGGVVRLEAPTHRSKAALVAAPPEAGRLVYVSLGSGGDIQPWHGWVFELDLDAWRAEGAAAAISAVLVTTPEAECPVEGESGAADMICGGGVWTHAGPQVFPTEGGFELIVPTGNGQLDLARGDFAQSLMRTGRGLRFDPGCDPELCTPFDPGDPDPACLESCRNLFVPRLTADEPPLRPASGACAGMSFMQCLARLDYDLGANAPVRVELDDGRAVLVQTGKEGGAYLLDAAHLGHLYDREQVVGLCGVPNGDCKYEEWRGTIMTQPSVTRIDGRPVVLIPTFVFDQSNPAGLVAFQIVTQDGEPRFERLWEAPDFASEEAVERFRYYPSRAALWTDRASGETYAFVVDIAATAGDATLLGVRVRDGEIVERRPLAGQGQPHLLPAVAGDVIYLPSDVADGGSQLEAYLIE